VLDKGLPLAQLPGLLDHVGVYIDIWKLGFGTAYVDPQVGDKVRVLAEYGIMACVGGTLLEAAWSESKAEECLAWAKHVGFPCVEVSNGATPMPSAEKRRLIATAAIDFSVVAETGSKDARAAVLPSDWAAEMAGDLEAGATWGLTEGRESGTVGLFDPDGSIRWDVVEAVVAAVGADRVIFEAPRTGQQAALMHRLGPNVSLGNVATTEVLAVEALRLGLRADTIGISRPIAAATGST
jgi:phosphosulfolactate synthase